MSTLGIHDAHDAGAGLVYRGDVNGAINEERFTKLKNDVGFPRHSISYLADKGDLEDIESVAIPWIGGSALFARIFPSLEVKRRKLWRREVDKPSRIRMHLTNLVFRAVQEQKPRVFWDVAGSGIGSLKIRSSLRALGMEKKRIAFVDHHLAHAASAYFASGFKEALVITLDGAGDGLSGTVYECDDGRMKRINEFRAGASLGILYGAATIACDMRYSEDEGKLMSLAAYSYPSEIKELDAISRYDERARQLVGGSGKKYEYLLAEYFKDTLLWKYNREAFAYAVQRHVEREVLKIARQHLKETGMRNLAVAGGVFSNIIINMRLNEMPEIKNFFVFPHMGDGGLSVGAAYYIDFLNNGKIAGRQIRDFYLGPSYSDEQIERVLKLYAAKKKISYEKVGDIARACADLLCEDNRIMLWFQGRMEYGPRALGNRSVLALPSDPCNRDKINFLIKKRPYYQPFASSMLQEDAKGLLDPCKGESRFMTIGYNVRAGRREELAAASHIDGTTRPQMLGQENKLFRELLLRVKKHTGIGAVVNTSLNKHGKPIVMTPQDALWTLLNTGAENLAIGNFLVEKRG